jgi:endonuclease YncB( thermonuclease family)
MLEHLAYRIYFEDKGSRVGEVRMRSWIAALIIVIINFGGVSRGAPIDPDQVQVIDGDTIRINGDKVHVRLVGFNAPETKRAKCEAERALGVLATQRLRDLVRNGGLDFELIQCSCREGTQGTTACNWGRKCGTLVVEGRDVGEILIRENLAVLFTCGPRSCPKTPIPWCS